MSFKSELQSNNIDLQFILDAVNNLPEVGSGGSSSLPSSYTKDVNFRDYDGTILYSYTKDEALALTLLPELPTQQGLICQGWNWSLEDMKSYVTDYGKLEIGATYITDDGKTRIYIHLEEGRTSPILGCCPNGTVTVDWGDGSTPDILTGTSTSAVKWTPTHDYASAGDYVIILSVSGSMGFFGNSSSNQYSGILRYSSSNDTRNYVYRNAVQKVEIGNGITSIGTYAFHYCQSLSSITIPNGITSIGNYAFQNCYSLSSITIPNSVTSIGTYAFNSCYSLSNVTIPNSVTSIGAYTFQYCYSLLSITIPDSVTSIGNNAFSNCYSLSGITISDSVKSIGNNAFQNCRSLLSIIIPDSVTSIGTYAFNYCWSLSSITIPNGVTSIGAYAFQYCYSLGKVRFESTTPPTVSNSSAFSGIPTDCIISVPTGSLSAYTSATNYPSSSTYTYVEEGNKDSEIITFTINDVEYQAENGMTWAEWCASEYNTVGGCIIAESLCIPNDTNGYNYVLNAKSSDIIVSGSSYIFNESISLEDEFEE